ncbi:23S rRNA (pseudouridine(1915)-N(3))-methyltransferase RlmH [bacterium]|nr:23S rRNA (pseudouridine(1915)-N(3))-methyltransferase RlmH [bacterium]
MKYSFLWIDASKEKFVIDAQKIYLNRLKHYVRFNEIIVKGQKISSKVTSKNIIELEGRRILDKIDDSSFVVVLDKDGDKCTSEQLAQKVQSWQNQSIRQIFFIIGGPLGLSDNVLKRANWRFSLSSLTLTHELARIIMLEQLYRAHTIIRGEKYHK